MNEGGIDWPIIINVLSKIAPPQLAEKWDNVGIQIDCNQKKIRRILLCLDVVSSVVKEAIQKNVDLIISHHPLIFSPLKKIDNSVEGTIIQDLIRAKISLYVMHTNLDNVTGGINDQLALLLGLDEITPFEFFDEQDPLSGRLGIYNPTKTLQEIVDIIKDVLSISYVKVVGELNKKIKRIALCSGSGASLINIALKNKAEVLITGDIKYHQAQFGLANDLVLIDVGHFNSEIIILPILLDKIKQETLGVDDNFNIIISEKEKDPFLLI